MSKVISVFNKDIKRNFSVRLVFEGDNYGLNMKLIWDNKTPAVEFYDASYDFDKDTDGKVLGQFISRYYHDTIMEIENGRGLTLDLSEKNVWSIDSDSIDLIKSWSNDNINRAIN